MADRPAQATRRVSVDDVADLLAAPPHATVAFVDQGRVRASPVSVRRQGREFLIGLPAGEAMPGEGTVASLVLDGGVVTSELRGARFRGPLHAAGDQGCSDGLTWFALVPDQVVAWDYGRMRRSLR